MYILLNLSQCFKFGEGVQSVSNMKKCWTRSNMHNPGLGRFFRARSTSRYGSCHVTLNVTLKVTAGCLKMPPVFAIKNCSRSLPRFLSTLEHLGNLGRARLAYWFCREKSASSTCLGPAESWVERWSGASRVLVSPTFDYEDPLHVAKAGPAPRVNLVDPDRPVLLL